MPRLSVPLTDEQHKAIKVKSAQAGLPQAEVARRLLLAWLDGEEQALELWRRWFEENDDVWVQDDYGRSWCSFCIEDEPNHADDCIYVAAKELVEK
jgi:hypothetical protein